MSSSVLTTIQAQLNLYQYPTFLLVGNIGNVFIVILFSRQRQNACAIYLMSSAIVNNLFLTFNIFTQMFPFYYADETIRAFALCKLRLYLLNIFGPIAKLMIILSCIDRFMITNDRVSFRAFSTPKRAKWTIFFSIIFWPLIVIHIPIMTTIVNGQCTTFGIYSIIYLVYVIIFVGFIPPIIMSIFGYLTYRNLRQRHVRVQPIVNNTNNGNIDIRKRDRALLIIVISEVFVYFVTMTPNLLVFLEMTISKYVMSNKSVQYIQIENFIFIITASLGFLNSAGPFYVYLISSKSFRHDFKQLIISCYRKIRRQTPILPGSTTHQNLTQRNTRV